MNKEVIENQEVVPKNLYFVSSEKDPTVLVAIDLIKKDNYLIWFDTVKFRMMEIDNLIKNENGEISFIRKDGDKAKYLFQPMTLDIYNSQIKDKLIYPKEVKDMENLRDIFEKSKGNY